MKYSRTTGARLGYAKGVPCSAQIRPILASISSEWRNWNTANLQHAPPGPKRFAADQGQFSGGEAFGGGTRVNNFMEPPGS
jgi:hypothetical protein